jgi:hypothetical protein
MSKINNSIFKQYLGSLAEFKSYYASLDDLQKAALSKALVFIHDKAVNDTWNNDGYIFANGKYYACRESAGLTLNTLLALIETGDTSGVRVEESNGKLVFTPIIKDELKALTSVGFVESGKTWAAGTDIETILNDIFAKEIWYKAEFNYAENLVVTMDKPTLTVTVDGVTATDSSTYEIGAPISVTGTMHNSTATGNHFTMTCKTAGNNGFVTNGNTSTKLTSLTMPATLSNESSDTLTAPTKDGGFSGVSVANNAISASGKVTSGTNSLTIKSTSKTYKLTANPTENVNNVLTTLSNKGNYSSNNTEDGVTIKHTVSKVHTESATPTSSISFNGKYKYYYVWGASSLPEIPESFNGDLTGWTSVWGSMVIYEGNPQALNGVLYVLKPSSMGAPKINNEFGQAGSFATESTAYTNKYATPYSLYSFTAAGASYKDLVL